MTCARITLDDREYKTVKFKETEWRQRADIKIYGRIRGAVEVFYMVEKPDIFEGPFLKEERDLVEAIAERVDRIVERAKDDEWDKITDRFVLFLNKQELVHLYSIVTETAERMEEIIESPQTQNALKLAEIYYKEIQHIDRSLIKKLMELLGE